MQDSETPVEPTLKDTVGEVKFYQKRPFKILAGLGLAALLLLLVVFGTMELGGNNGVGITGSSAATSTVDKPVNSRSNMKPLLVQDSEPQVGKFERLIHFLRANWKLVFAVSVLVIVLVSVAVGLAVYFEQDRLNKELIEKKRLDDEIAAAEELESQKLSGQQESNALPDAEKKVDTGMKVLIGFYGLNLIGALFKWYLKGMPKHFIGHTIVSIIFLQSIIYFLLWCFSLANRYAVMFKRKARFNRIQSALVIIAIIFTRLFSMIFGLCLLPFILLFKCCKSDPKFVKTWEKLWSEGWLESIW